MSIAKNLKEIETACYEIAELLKMGPCQKPQVVTEVEIILENVNKIKQGEEHVEKE